MCFLHLIAGGASIDRALCFLNLVPISKYEVSDRNVLVQHVREIEDALIFSTMDEANESVSVIKCMVR